MKYKCTIVCIIETPEGVENKQVEDMLAKMLAAGGWDMGTVGVKAEKMVEVVKGSFI